MDAKEKIQALLETSKDGTVTAAQVSAAGRHRSILQYAEQLRVKPKVLRYMEVLL